MFVVFHLEAGVPQSRSFTPEQMTDALTYCEDLRTQRREQSAPISHVTMASENPNSVGQAGVAEVGPDYNWKKRR